MDCINAFSTREKFNSLNDVTAPNKILVCSTGDSWDVAVIIDDEEVETHWFERKADALRKARRLFNEKTEIAELGVESRLDCTFSIIRTR